MKALPSIKLSICVVLMFSAVCFSGCTYMKNRTLDFADIFTGKVTSGYGLHAGASVFGILCGYAGGMKSFRAGYEGRYYIEDEVTIIGVPVMQVGAPIYHLYKTDKPVGLEFCLIVPFALVSPGFEMDELIESVNFENKSDVKMGYASLIGFNIIPIIHKGKFGRKPERGGKIHYFDLKASASCFVGLEVGVNIFEFVDFLLGWTTLDIAGDDTKTAKPEKAKSENQPDKK